MQYYLDLEFQCPILTIELVILHYQAKNYLWWSYEENPLTRRHGSLSVLDMIMPFVAFHNRISSTRINHGQNS